MKKNKFLTVYAVLDDATQQELNKIQQSIIKKFPNGTQTMGIPFHISLGSFKLEEKAMLIERIAKKIEELKPFSINLQGVSHFNYSVLYLKPEQNDLLEAIHKNFNDNYSDGFDWVPHVTLYCGEKEEVKYLLSEYQGLKLNCKIVGLELGEFFPPKIILTSKF